MNQRASIFVAIKKKTFALIGIGLLFCGSYAVAQEGGSNATFQIVDGNSGQVINNGATLYLDGSSGEDTWTTSLVNAGQCDKVTYTITFTWTDSHNPNGIPPYSTNYGFTGPTGQEIIVLNEGGNALVTWQINGGATQSMAFKLLGQNPSLAMVKGAFITPWYFPQITEQESNALQFTSSGNPKVNGNPPGTDGIGIAQVDGVTSGQTITLSSYFGWTTNGYQGVYQANIKAIAANSFWNSQLQQATSANPPPDQYQVYNCTFGTSPNVHSWADADAINGYNGTGSLRLACPAPNSGTISEVYPSGYFISWSGLNATDGQWQIKTEQNGCWAGRSYVGDVCKQP
jgi:hypothetical protein